MKTWKLMLSVAVLIGAAFPILMAGPEYCGKITDSDLRNLCTAETSRNSAYCDRIKNDDQRHYCQALAEKNSAYCDKVDNADLKNYCRAKL